MSPRRLIAPAAVIVLAAGGITGLAISQDHEVDRTVAITGIVHDPSGSLSIRADKLGRTTRAGSVRSAPPR